MEYIRIIGERAGFGGGGVDISTENAVALVALVVVAVIIGIIIMRRG